jgi:hypothetical protein
MSLTINVTSTLANPAPFPGTWETQEIGYVSTDSNLTGAMGIITSNQIFGNVIESVGLASNNSILPAFNNANGSFLLLMQAGSVTNLFSQITVNRGGVYSTYTQLSATLLPGGTQIGPGGPIIDGPCYVWPAPVAPIFAAGLITTLTITAPLTAPTAPSGNGDITDPAAWQDSSGNIPPAQFSNVPYNVNYPLNGDGRYWFQANAYAPNVNVPITFIGNPAYVSTGSANLQWSVVSTANDGSGLILAYSTTTGTWVTATLLPQTQLGGIQNGQVQIPLAGATQFQVQVYAQGGTSLSTASLSEVAVAITRNYNEGITWDGFVNPFDPVNYNALVVDNNIPTATMTSLQYRMMVRLGFANQANNPPPGMSALTQDFLTAAQTFLYKRYVQLHTKRFFRWKINPGQRFYSLKDNDENVLENVNMDPTKCIEWAGIQDSRNVWYPMIQGIPPQLYTMITKPWRPARYELRNAIEIYPVPDQTYWLWVRAHFGLMSFINPSDTTTIDSELVFLWALANAKAHYGQPDANQIAGQANTYKAELIAATHQTAHYLPGTIAVPPAVRPTLIQFDANNGGGS